MVHIPDIIICYPSWLDLFYIPDIAVKLWVIIILLNFNVLGSRHGGVLFFGVIYLYNDGIILFIRTAVILVGKYLQVVFNSF